jgi:peptidoglycan/xylan/chitin deacetylase (PgdA/CDA1 family)
MRLLPFFATAVLALSLVSELGAQTHTVALTIDDLPFITEDSSRPMQPVDAKSAAASNHKLLVALARHHVPVTGFVIQKGVEELGIVSGTDILREWTRRGFDLGNHTYAHPDSNNLTIEQYEDQITRGEAAFVPVMKAAGRKPEFFRFPFNHTGDTKEKRDALAAFLAQRGYRLAPCTIETSDWMFNIAYGRMIARHDHASAARLRTVYLAFTSAQIDYFMRLNTQVLGHEPPEIMLLHDNQLNADTISDLLALFEKKHYRWVSLSEAESDPVYLSPDSIVTKYGPMWGYRWAKERGVKVVGSLEQEPPPWITDYGREEPAPPRRPRSEF